MPLLDELQCLQVPNGLGSWTRIIAIPFEQQCRWIFVVKECQCLLGLLFPLLIQQLGILHFAGATPSILVSSSSLLVVSQLNGSSETIVTYILKYINEHVIYS